jgi:uncharacterized lipoprotein
MRLFAAAFALLLLTGLSACSLFRSDAEINPAMLDLSPLKLPEGQTRPIAPLYPVPPAQAGKDVAFDPDKKYEAPKPKPLVLDASQQVTAPLVNVDALSQKPVLTQDGNGYPVISISGDFNTLWDKLDASLRAAKVKIDDRDQRVGLYFLHLDENGSTAPYQLHVSRGQSDYTLALQKDDETLAPEALTKSLFSAIVDNWPAADSRRP